MLKHFNKNYRNNRNISIFTSISYHSVFIWPPFLFFQHNQQCDTLLPIVPCTHKLKAGIAYYNFFRFSILMVVGAGRGPLVRASFAASQACGRGIKVYAIEKNPNAIVTYVCVFILIENREKNERKNECERK
jgi:hypothetical protein